MLPRQTNRTRISAANSSVSDGFQPPLIGRAKVADTDASTCFVPLLEAAKTIGCRPLTLARSIKRAGPFDPVGARLWRREWVVYRNECEGARLAMNRRRLVTSVGVAQP